MKKNVVYKDPWLTIIEQSAIVRGKKIVVHRHLHKDVIVVLPLTKDGYFIIEKQFRHGLGKWLVEVPAGLIEKGENPIVAAKRELEEETGFKAGKMKFMFKQYESPAVGKTQFHYYFAQDLQKGNKKFDDSENIEIIKIKPEKLSKMIKSHHIKDHKTISAYLYYKAFVAKK